MENNEESFDTEVEHTNVICKQAIQPNCENSSQVTSRSQMAIDESH